MNLCRALGLGGAFNADTFFSKLLTRIFRSKISCCISLSVCSDTNSPSYVFGQTYNEIGDINKIYAEKIILNEYLLKILRF